jgi:hypothetical protein
MRQSRQGVILDGSGGIGSQRLAALGTYYAGEVFQPGRCCEARLYKKGVAVLEVSATASSLARHIQVVAFTKTAGPLTKRISLGPDGKPVSDGSACVMSSGDGQRIYIAGPRELATLIPQLGPENAIALGTLQQGVPDQVKVTTKKKLDQLNGEAAPALIARSGEFITYRPKQPAFALLDCDTKGMPHTVRETIKDHGGFLPALISVFPELKNVSMVERRSTSAGLFRTDTGEKFAGSAGLHIFIQVEDGEDVERFLQNLHDRLWLADLGWMMVGKAGQFLERSLIDRSVFGAERLVFEGAPVLDPPLGQDKKSREPIIRDGEPLDTITAFPPPSIVEQAKLRDLRAKDMHRLGPDASKVRKGFIRAQAERFGVSPEAVARMCKGVLLPWVVLPFDDPDLADKTVADVLADPSAYEGATLADPLEGIEYGRCKAKIMRHDDGTPWIRSFAHGLTTYQLKLDAAAVENALNNAPADKVVNIFVQLALKADLDDEQTERLLAIAAKLGKTGKMVVKRMLKAARTDLARRRAEEERNQRAAERRDPRPRIMVPEESAPWLPQVQVLNEVLGKIDLPEPPMRNSDGVVTVIRCQRMPLLHALTALGSNSEETEETRLPAPEHPLLAPLNEVELAELIERFIDYYNPDSDKSVHLPGLFVKHYLKRDDNAIPTVFAVATMPMVLPDGTILSGRGLDRQYAVVFRVPDELQALLPRQQDCTRTAVAKAMRFLTDAWLCDVATDYAGKCILIAMTLTILERLLLPERPAFFITAGQRGGGKTTAVNMISMAALGARAAAAAWSPNEEERRKALFAYLLSGVPLLMWDNIPRGAAISCPSIEKALTTPQYSDRVLCESNTRNVNATSIMGFTGNNIAARGDLASRQLTVRISVNRPDPENRTFKHADPITWTEANRGKILAALYTILLGNPRLRPGFNGPPAKTRFKPWWHLLGAGVEHAAAQHVRLVNEEVAAMVADPPDNPPTTISFEKLFLSGESEEEQSGGLAAVIDVLGTKWPYGCRAVDIAVYAGQNTPEAEEFRSNLEAAGGKPMKTVTARTVTWVLKAMVDAPVRVGDDVMVLRYRSTGSHHSGTFVVQKMDDQQ